jgi:hypothetical protein
MFQKTVLPPSSLFKSKQVRNKKKQTFSRLQGVTTQKTVLFVVTGERTCSTTGLTSVPQSAFSKVGH